MGCLEVKGSKPGTTGGVSVWVMQPLWRLKTAPTASLKRRRGQSLGESCESSFLGAALELWVTESTCFL